MLVLLWCRCYNDLLYELYMYGEKYMGKQSKLFGEVGNKVQVNLEEELELEREKNKSLQKELQFYRRFDAVSGLYNRITFYTETAKMLADNRQNRFVMLRMDMERFKIINELWGRAEGDRLLRYIGEKLRKKLIGCPNVTFGRTEADIFYMCFLYSEQDIDDKISYIEDILKDYKIDFQIVPYFGLYIITNHDMPINLMCDRTNLAIRTIKGNYMKRVAFYDENLRKAMLWEQEIINQMGTALLTKQFEIYLQPQCDIQTGQPISAEALVRWNHPERGILSPAEFIPIFEKNRFIMKLDFYVWEQTCILLRQWMDEGKKPHPISVNVSRINLHNPKLCDIIIELVKKYDIPPRLLELEITESAYADNQKLLIVLIETLQNYGFTVLMDDFGSGYSSLNMLKETVVDVLKLDLVFLSGDGKADRGGNILASIMSMAKWLNMAVIAEGVETREQADFLRSIGCRVAQGYYYARPMPVKDYENYLKRVEVNGSILAFQELKEQVVINEFWDPSAKVNYIFNTIVSAVGIYEWSNNQLEAIRLNDSYFEMIGESREEYYLKGLRVLDFVPDEEKAIVTNMIHQAIKTKNIGEATYRRRCVHGNYIWLKAKARYLAGDEERSLFYVAMNDVTEMKSAQENLEESVYNLKMLVNYMPGGVLKISADDKKKIIFMNQHMENLLECPEAQLKELYNTPFQDIVANEDRDRILKELEEASNTSEIRKSIVHLKIKSGQRKKFLMEGRVMKDMVNHNSFFLVLSDA